VAPTPPTSPLPSTPAAGQPQPQPVQPPQQPLGTPGYHALPHRYGRPQGQPAGTTYAPPAATGSYSAAPHGNYRSARTWFKPTFYVPVLLVLAVLGGGTATFAAWRTQSSPDAVFRSALTDALSQSYYTQVTSQDKVSATVHYDAHDITKPQVLTDANVFSDDLTVGFDGYGTIDSRYTRVTMQKNETDNKFYYSIGLNKWIKVDDRDEKFAKNSVSMLYDPRQLMLGNIIVGNFSKTQREQLVDYAIKNKVYEFDPANVTKDDSEAYKSENYVYKVKFNGKKLYEYNRLAASMMKLDASVVQDMLESKELSEGTISIDAKTKQFTQVKINSVESIYMDWGRNMVSGEPKPELSSGELVKKGFSSPFQAYINPTNGTPQGLKNDQIRKSNVDEIARNLDEYFLVHRRYPMLEQFNNASWVHANMPGAAPDRPRDPEGISSSLASRPTPGAYSYQPIKGLGMPTCDNSKLICENYIVTAVLSDGSIYKRDSAIEAVLGR
jgi:hypothetical protein